MKIQHHLSNNLPRIVLHLEFINDQNFDYTKVYVIWLINIIPNTQAGVLQEEIRYITESNPFGNIDDRKATNMVGSIILTIDRK